MGSSKCFEAFTKWSLTHIAVHLRTQDGMTALGYLHDHIVRSFDVASTLATVLPFFCDDI